MASTIEMEFEACGEAQRRETGRLLRESGYDIYCAESVMPPNNRVTRLLGRVISSCSVESALDVGCGTGILALIAARRCGHVRGVDISPAAVECARGNALRNALAEAVQFDLGDAFEGVHGRRFDLIFSNPPFYPAGRPRLDAADISLLPIQANGLIEKLIHSTRHHLNPGGRLLFVTSSLSDNRTIASMLANLGHRYSCTLLREGGAASQDILLWDIRPS